ncbi:MAG: hypothetical protein V3V23_08130, partial [Dehalococcoidales bacterium]
MTIDSPVSTRLPEVTTLPVIMPALQTLGRTGFSLREKTGLLIKSLAFLSFALTVFVVILLRNSPTTGYEASIYTHTPSIVWAVLIFNIVCGSGIIIHQVYTRREECSRLWLFGLLIIIVSFGVLFSVPGLRDYALYGRGDALSHLGKLQHFIATGELGRNFYPGFYFLVAWLARILHIELVTLFAYLPALLGILFLSFMYLFARTVLPKKGQAMLATVAGAFVLTSGSVGPVALAPNTQTNMLLPLVFFLCVIYLAREPVRFRVWLLVPLIMLLVWLPVLHLLPALITLMLMLSLCLPVGIYNLIWSRKGNLAIPRSYRIFTPVTLLLIVAFTAWMYFGGGLVTGSSRIAVAVAGPSTAETYQTVNQNLLTDDEVYQSESGSVIQGQTTGWPGIDGILRQVAISRYYGYNIWEQFFKRFGEALLFIAVMVAVAPVIIRRLSSNPDLAKLLSLYGLPLAFIPFTLLLLWINSPFGITRLLFYVALVGAVFAGFALYELLGWIRRAPSRRVFWLVPLTAIIVLLSVNGVFKTYYSRYTLTPSGQVTWSEIKGMTWFFENKDTSIVTISNSTSLSRFADLLLSPEERLRRTDIPKNSHLGIPSHFNYQINDMMGQSFYQDAYMIITE